MRAIETFQRCIPPNFHYWSPELFAVCVLFGRGSSTRGDLCPSVSASSVCDILTDAIHITAMANTLGTRRTAAVIPMQYIGPSMVNMLEYSKQWIDLSATNRTSSWLDGPICILRGAPRTAIGAPDFNISDLAVNALMTYEAVRVFLLSYRFAQTVVKSSNRAIKGLPEFINSRKGLSIPSRLKYLEIAINIHYIHLLAVMAMYSARIVVSKGVQGQPFEHAALSLAESMTELSLHRASKRVMAGVVSQIDAIHSDYVDAFCKSIEEEHHYLYGKFNKERSADQFSACSPSFTRSDFVEEYE